MQTVELTAHLKKINRLQGRTATAAAAYRACALIECEREGRVHDYRRKSGMEAAEIILPGNAPAWASSRSGLWNAAEMRERNGKRGPNAGAFKIDAVTAREIMFGFPAGLSEAGRLDVARAIARHLVDRHGVAADFAIHAPGKAGDQRNHHCHLMFSTRRMTADGFTRKTREWDDVFTGSRTLAETRAFIAGAMNTALGREGLSESVFVEHRSFAERGIGTTPTRHQGPGKTNAVRKRKSRDRTMWERTERERQKERHGLEVAALRKQHEATLTAKQTDIDRRERQTVERVRSQMEAQRSVAEPARGIGRLVEIVTGQAAKNDAERQNRAADRQQEMERRITGLRAEFHAERTAFVSGQAREAQATNERQRGEDQQLFHAASARADRDRQAERDMRHDQAHRHSHDRQHERLHQRGHERTITPD